MKIELVADYQCVTAEGPLWHADEQRLYWVDLRRGHLYRYTPASGQHEKIFDDPQDVVGGFTVQADGSLLLFMSRGAIRIWRAGRLTTVVNDLPWERESRFNDVIADPEGRVFCGTMPSPDHPARLYRLDRDGSVTELLEGIGVSNGLGFTLDRQHLYYTDTGKRTIYLFDYDQATGAIANQRGFLQPKDEGGPDGMTVDAEGYVWSARWGGSCLVRYAPDGREERRIYFPARKVSSLTFGGADLTDIYVTTAGGNNRREEGPGAGAIFRVNAGIRGLPEFRSRVCLS